MRGCGRQKIGAAVNLATYWGLGLPIACLLAFPGGLGALGLWTGLACTASVQALLMTLTVFRCAPAGGGGLPCAARSLPGSCAHKHATLLLPACMPRQLATNVRSHAVSMRTAQVQLGG